MEAIARGERGAKVNIIAPRGSAKTSIMAEIYPMHCVYYKECYELLDMQPDTFIFIVSHSYRIAVQRVRTIMRKFETHEPFKHLVGAKTWGISELHTSNQIVIMPQGRGGQVRGALVSSNRPSLIITDDLEEAESCRNPDQRSKNLEWFDTDLMRAGSIDGSTNFINIDTLKHQEAITNKLRSRPAWRSQLHKAIIEPALLYHPTAEDLWQEWTGIYTDMTLDNDERNDKAQSFYELNKNAMIEEVDELWEQRITYLDVRKEMCDVGYHAVMRELQNDVDAGGQNLFDMQNAVRFVVTDDGLMRTDDRLVRWAEIAGATVFLDWAGGRDTVENAYACAVAVLWQPMRGAGNRTDVDTLAGTNGYVFETWLDRVGITEQMGASLDLAEKVLATVLAKAGNQQIHFVVEDFVQDTWSAMKESVQRAFSKEKENRYQLRDVHLQFLPRSRNKIERITALEPSIKNGWLAFNENLTDPFLSQMKQFPTADHLDGPDALEGATNFRVTTTAKDRAIKRERAQYESDNFGVEL